MAKKNGHSEKQISGSFEDIIKASVSGNPKPKAKKKVTTIKKNTNSKTK